MFNINLPDIILPEEQLDFKALEKILFDYVCRLGCMIMKILLEQCDKRLMESRDKEAYRHKGYKKTCIKTLMGPVEFKRAVYKYKDEEGKKQYRYLLDEYLNLDTIGFMSVNLVEKAVENITNVSYRKTADNITKMTGQSISHTAVWNLVQELGNRITKREKEKIERYLAGELNGDREVKVLFEEVDGLWINMQGKDRPKRGRSKKKEIKFAVTYEGFKKKQEKKGRYLLHNKRAVAGFMDAEEFKDLRDANIAERYNVDKIELRLINGDGASWIKQGIDEEGCCFQLDPFHKSRAVIRNVYDKREAKKILKLLREGKEDKALKRIRELKYESGGEKDKVKKLQELEKYLEENREWLKPYKKREEINLPELPEGLYYRNMGTGEHNICDTLKLRMKGNKTSWSEAGANNLAKILCAKISGELYEIVNGLLSSVVPEQMTKEFTQVIKNVSKKVKKTNVYPVHNGGMPFEGCALTEGIKAIRNLVKGTALTDY